MPWANNPEINSLRMKYNAALAARQGCQRALIVARMEGREPPRELVEAEAEAMLLLEAVRAELLAAMTRAIKGGVEFEPPSSQA